MSFDSGNIRRLCFSATNDPEIHLFQHQPLPSAFSVAEAPTWLCWQGIIKARSLWIPRETSLKNKTFAILIGGCSYLGGIIALPITLCLTPVTIVADIIIGVGECFLCFYHYQKLAKGNLRLIAHRKFIVSPCQQLIFCIPALAYSCVMCLAYFSQIDEDEAATSLYVLYVYILLGFITWPIIYNLGQRFVGSLPKTLNHHSFNIFIRGGGGECGVKWLDGYGLLDPPTFRITPEMRDWMRFVRSKKEKISNIDDPDDSKIYREFKHKILTGGIITINPIFLLRVSNLPEQDIQRNFREIAKAVHPDRNRHRLEEATALFEILHEARKRYDKIE